MVPFQSLQAAKEQCGRIQTLFFLFFFFAARHTRIWPFFVRTINQILLEALELSGLAGCDGGVRIDTIFNPSADALSRLPLKYRPRARSSYRCLTKEMTKTTQSQSNKQASCDREKRNEVFEPLLKVASVCVCVHVWGSSLAWVGFVCKRKSRKDACLSRRLTRSSDRRAGLRT